MIGVVAGMQAELETLGRWREDGRVIVGVSGARPAQAEAEARRLVAEGARLLVSYGVAGGLDPQVKTGDLVSASEIVDEEDFAWPQVAPAFDPSFGVARRWILGVDRVIGSVAEKAALHEKFQAAAVDMESHRVARVASAAEVPMATFRAVADPHDQAIPRLAAEGLGPDGRPRVGTVIQGLLKRPRALPELLSVKRDVDVALARLSAAIDVVAPLLLAARRS